MGIKNASFIIATGRIKWLRINLMWNVQDLAEENFKTQLALMMTLVSGMFSYVLG